MNVQRCPLKEDLNIQKVIEIAQTQNGIVTSTQVTEAGIPRRILSWMVKFELLIRMERGIYILPQFWPDDLYILQQRFSRGVFSHETALYLHDMSDRTPSHYTMTFPFGYNTHRVINEGVIAKVVNQHTYPLGVIEMPSLVGNLINVYDVERTLCDLVKTRHGGDIQILNQAMKKYAESKEKDLAKLFDYASQLRVKEKILTYMQILL